MKAISGFLFLFLGFVFVLTAWFIKPESDVKKAQASSTFLGGASLLGIGLILLLMKD